MKQLPPGYTDSQLYDLFRPFGALASVRTQAPFGKDTGVVEFWREEDAREAEEAMHCAEVEGQNIVVQIYQPRRAGAALSEFSPNAPSFVPTGSVYPYPAQVRTSRTSPCIASLTRRNIVLAPSAVTLPLSSAIRSWTWAASAARSLVRSRIDQS